MPLDAKASDNLRRGVLTRMSEKESKNKKQEEKVADSEEEGYYCIYCGDFVKKGQYHHH